eukprot:3090523-Pyramimonas_sp.AAC.1
MSVDAIHGASERVYARYHHVRPQDLRAPGKKTGERSKYLRRAAFATAWMSVNSAPNPISLN